MTRSRVPISHGRKRVQIGNHVTWQTPDAFRELLGPVGSAISRTFDRMVVAEEEIVKAKARHPAKQDRIWKSFKLLIPTFDLSDVVYRHHCQELLERVAVEKDTRPGTKAEVLAAISVATLASRLDRDVELLGLRLCDEICDSKLAEERAEEIPNHCDALLVEFRKKCSKDDRVI